jgi:hypothetical protein
MAVADRMQRYENFRIDLGFHVVVSRPIVRAAPPQSRPWIGRHHFGGSSQRGQDVAAAAWLPIGDLTLLRRTQWATHCPADPAVLFRDVRGASDWTNIVYRWTNGNGW